MAPERIAFTRSTAVKPLRVVIAKLRADAADGNQLLEQRFVAGIDEAEQQERVFTDMGMNVEFYRLALFGERRKGRYGDGHFVSDAVDVDDDGVGVLFEKRAAEMSNHEE